MTGFNISLSKTCLRARSISGQRKLRNFAAHFVIDCTGNCQNDTGAEKIKWLPFCLLLFKSPAWLVRLSSWWYLIRITYGQCSMSSGWLNRLRCYLMPVVSHPDDLWTMPYVSDGLWCYHKLSGWHNDIWTLYHPADLAPGGISAGWLMAYAVSHPGDIR